MAPLATRRAWSYRRAPRTDLPVAARESHSGVLRRDEGSFRDDEREQAFEVGLRTMSMYYSMILVPSDPFFRPKPEQMVRFLARILELGAVGSARAVRLRDYQKGRVSIISGLAGQRPGESIKVKMPDFIELDSVNELLKAMQGLTDFDALIEGTGPARKLPIRNVGGYDNGVWKPLEDLISSEVYVNDYELRVECCQRSKLTSTSDLHEETLTDCTAEPFGETCELAARVGLYSNPETIELISVPNAGCCTFWVAFTLGKWMFPTFASNRIDFVDPIVMRLAETAFGIQFAEGCCWG